MPKKRQISLLFCFSAPFFERGSVSEGFAKSKAQSTKGYTQELKSLKPTRKRKAQNTEGLHSSLPRVAPIKRTPRLPKRAQCSSLVPTKRKISLERYRGGFISTTFIVTSEFWDSSPLTNFMRCKAKAFTQSGETVKFRQGRSEVLPKAK